MFLPLVTSIWPSTHMQCNRSIQELEESQMSCWFHLSPHSLAGC